VEAQHPNNKMAIKMLVEEEEAFEGGVKTQGMCVCVCVCLGLFVGFLTLSNKRDTC
jgi:hypothetical protein